MKIKDCFKGAFLTTIVFLSVFGSKTIFAEILPPFSNEANPIAKPPKGIVVEPIPVDCMGKEKTVLWSIDGFSGGSSEGLFALEDQNGKGVLKVVPALFKASSTTLKMNLPGGAAMNGAVWNKNKANYISFNYKCNKSVLLSFHTLEKGKIAGSYSFNAGSSEWQQAIVSISDLNIKNLGKVSGFAFQVLPPEEGDQIDKEAIVYISDFNVGGIPYTDDGWNSSRFTISLDGRWYFSPDSTNEGLKNKWNTESFDHSAWQVLRSNLSWSEQGVKHHGFGWYRQKIMIPKEFADQPLTINLNSWKTMDDAWFNGQHIGGIRGDYQYQNLVNRSYVVPPSAIKYGELNTIVIRVWGGDDLYFGDGSGLIKGGVYTAEFNPFYTKVRDLGGEPMHWMLYDFSDAQHGKPFDLIFTLPALVGTEPGSQLKYRLTDFSGKTMMNGKVPLPAATGSLIEVPIHVDKETAQTIYLRGRFRLNFFVGDVTGKPVYTGVRTLDHLSFKKRDELSLPALNDQSDETPYGKLKLVDEVDCSKSIDEEEHPYLQSGLDGPSRSTPGTQVQVNIHEIFGKKARESDYGWFAYRIGRGKLKPHTDYLVRVEYAEDKPRYGGIELQSGQNYTDNGWKNGISSDDVYDNWPLSHSWQWFDTIFPLDDETVGTNGISDASSENGFWIYIINKVKPNSYNCMYSGGPAISQIKLYEIDVNANSPLIQKPKDLPQRVMTFDWERGPDYDPEDYVRYAKLMGYSTISPLAMTAWTDLSFLEPLNGYNTLNTDEKGYMVKKVYDPLKGKTVAEIPVPGKPSSHLRYLEATKKYGLNYMPRCEWGGSKDLPREAWAIGADGDILKPSRYAAWCCNLLNPLTRDDFQKLMDHAIKPYVKDHPQLTGILWRIRSDRVPISYGPEDIKLFSKETGIPIPPGGAGQWSAWAASEMRVKYDDWWHQKRADFHKKLVDLLRSYRSDLTICYYNWDEDKYGLIENNLSSWSFLGQAAKEGKEAYIRDRTLRKTFTAQDYLDVFRTGNFGKPSHGVNRADYGIRPGLYKEIKGIQLFCPMNYLCYAAMPEYINYFQDAEGAAMSNVISYDEVARKGVNPKYETTQYVPAGSAFSMALELLSYFHGDARTLTFTSYTYGRGFADAHRRFAQAFLALPAISGDVIDQGDADLKVRTYTADHKTTYIGVAYKGYQSKKLLVKVPVKSSSKIKDLVTNQEVPFKMENNTAIFEINSDPMQLNSYLIQ